MSAIEDYIDHMNGHAPGHATLTKDARAELAALRARVAELEEAHVYLDESPVNYPDDDEVHTLADRIAPIVGEIIDARKTIAELEDQADQFRFLLVANNAASARDLGGVIDKLVKENEKQLAEHKDFVDRTFDDMTELRITIAQQDERIKSLKMQADLVDDYSETVRMHEITIEQQAAQLEQARTLIDKSELSIERRFSDDEFEHFYHVHHRRHAEHVLRDEMREWLNTNPVLQSEAHK